MSGLTPLVDTLLATRLAQRVDLIPLKSEVAIAAPQAVTSVEEVVNDVRQPSRALMLQHLGLGLLKNGNSSDTLVSAQPDKSVTLSIAARTVAAILASSPDASAQIVGAEPLWSKEGPPLVSLLSAKLAHAVANSGLFYESHLAQYAAGTRTLAQLAQEPQAGLDASVKAKLILSPADAQGRGSELSGAVAGNARLVEYPALAGKAPQQVAAGNAFPLNRGTPGEIGAVVSLQNSESDGRAANADSIRLAASPAIYLQPDVFGSIQKTDPKYSSEKNHVADGLESARNSPSGLVGVHPDAVALVRQQLELLATPIFRWQGEAWPGVSMNWEVHDEQDEQDDTEKRESSAANMDVPRTWSTRLLLGLPRLKDIEVRISMLGTSLQVHLAASENATRDLLGADRAELLRRMDELGLQMTGLQIGALATPSDLPQMLKDDHDW